MKGKNLKQQNGIVITDALLAILILAIFTGLITSLIYGIILSSKKVKINSQEIDYITEVFNYIDQLNYAEVTETNLINYINDNPNNNGYISAGSSMEGLTTPYKMTIKVTKYNETEGNTDKYDFIKIITIRLEYTIADKNYSTEMSMLKKVNNSELENAV